MKIQAERSPNRQNLLHGRRVRQHRLRLRHRELPITQTYNYYLIPITSISTTPSGVRRDLKEAVARTARAERHYQGPIQWRILAQMTAGKKHRQTGGSEFSFGHYASASSTNDRGLLTKRSRRHPQGIDQDRVANVAGRRDQVFPGRQKQADSGRGSPAVCAGE